MQHVLPDKLSVTAIFLVLGSVPDYCIFYIYIHIKAARHSGKDFALCFAFWSLHDISSLLF